MKNDVTIRLPYGLTLEEAVLDPTSHDVEKEDVIRVLNLLDDEELDRVLRGAAVLTANGAGTPWQCIDTAIVWERG